MKLKSVYTNRNRNCWPSWHIVHEWEDIFSEKLNAPLKMKPRGKTVYLFDLKHLPKKFIQSENYYLSFFLSVPDLYRYRLNPNLIPVVIDFWQKDFEMFHAVSKCFRNIYVTNLDVYNELQRSGYKNVRYMPLSLPDKYKISHSCVDEKDIDVIQIGRKNEVINNYMEKFLQKYPEVNYIRQEMIDSKLHYVSSTKGDLGSFHTREEYMKLISRCKISLLSSPGKDNSVDTGGYNPVTPRFYESAANYCYMMGRYPDNADFEYCKIPDVCEKIEDYDLFEKSLLSKLETKFDQFTRYDSFLAQHFTTQRVNQLVNDLGMDLSAE